MPGHTLAGRTQRQNHTVWSLPLAMLVLLVWVGHRHLSFFRKIAYLLHCILCICVFCLHVCLCITCATWCPWRSEEVIRFPRTVVTGDYEPPCERWQLTLRKSSQYCLPPCISHSSPLSGWLVCFCICLHKQVAGETLSSLPHCSGTVNSRLARLGLALSLGDFSLPFGDSS